MDTYDFGGFSGVTGANPFEPDGRPGSNCGGCAGTPEDKCVSSPRGDVYYWVTKSAGENAPWLILLHGAGMDHSVFDGVTDAFSGSVNIITLDLPLHGLSEEYGDFALDSCAYDVRDILNNEGVERACVAGHCIGGCAAQAFAREFPKYCTGLVLIDTFPFGQELYGYGDFRWLEKTSGVLRTLPARAFAAVMSGVFTASVEGNRTLMHIMVMQNTASVVDALVDTLMELSATETPQYDFPVLEIVGVTDRIGRIRGLNEKAADKCGYILAPIEHAGHTPYLDNPEEFNWALEGFLRDL